MKIAHVVTYVSEDGAFGGPVAVAVGHARELARRGHEVDLIAGWDGTATLDIPGVAVRLFPIRRLAPGLGGLTSPALLAWLRANASAFDVVHVHMGRDLITLPAAVLALSRQARVHLQTHGMVMPDGRWRAGVLDWVLTRRALRGASTVFVLTDAEQAGIQTVARRKTRRVEQIPNGVAVHDSKAQRRTDPPTVLFLARLHERKRVLAFAAAARILIERGADAVFRVVGPDEGDLAELMSYKAAHTLDRLEYAGAVAPGGALEELAAATIYVLPSFGEVFPMTVLEAFAAGTPVILSRDCAIAAELDRRGAAELTTGDPDDIARAIGNLLGSEAARSELVASANEALADWLAIDAVADRLEEAYA